MQPNQPDQQGSDLPPRLSSPAQRALANAGITSLEQLAAYTEAQIAAMHGIGPNALKQLRTALESHGLSYSDAP